MQSEPLGARRKKIVRESERYKSSNNIPLPLKYQMSSLKISLRKLNPNLKQQSIKHLKKEYLPGHWRSSWLHPWWSRDILPSACDSLPRQHWWPSGPRDGTSSRPPEIYNKKVGKIKKTTVYIHFKTSYFLTTSILGVLLRMWGKTVFPPRPHASRSRADSATTALVSLSSSATSSETAQSSSSSISVIMWSVPWKTGKNPEKLSSTSLIFLKHHLRLPEWLWRDACRQLSWP